MKCPECKRKMIFDREIKDYYCTYCKSSLEDLLEDDSEGSAKIKKTEKTAETDETTTPSAPMVPEAGTPKGLLFMLFGSIIILIAPLVCQIISIVGFFLLIIGFYLIYQERRKYSSEHILSIRIAAILLVIWIILNIIPFIYLYFVGVNIENEIANLNDNEMVSPETINYYFQNLKIFSILSFISITIFAVLRFLTIRGLIQINLKKILTIIVPILIFSGFLSMFVAMDFYEQHINELGDVTKSEFVNNDFNNSSRISPDFTVFYGAYFLNVSTEAILILCFYWTYTYQRSKQE